MASRLGRGELSSTECVSILLAHIAPLNPSVSGAGGGGARGSSLPCEAVGPSVPSRWQVCKRLFGRAAHLQEGNTDFWINEELAASQSSQRGLCARALCEVDGAGARIPF